MTLTNRREYVVVTKHRAFLVSFAKQKTTIRNRSILKEGMGYYAVANPVRVPLLLLNASVSSPNCCNMDKYRFDSGTRLFPSLG
jgi:hypothetical protein